MTERFLDLDTLLKQRGLRHGVGDFQGTWDRRHPFNIPRPIYIGPDDVSGNGREEAPMNVILLVSSEPELMGSFVFRQPNAASELDAVISAASSDVFRSYGLDGNAHWTREKISAWWLWSQAEQRSLQRRPEYAPWVSFMRYDAKLYLRRYVALLETGSVPTRRARLPEL